MKKKDIIELIKHNSFNKVKLGITDIDGILRGKIIHKEKFLEIIEHSLGFCDVIFGWDANDTCYDNATFTGWHTGYPDAKIFLDVETYRNIPWDNGIPFFLADMSGDSIEKESVCPRTLLKQVIRKADLLKIKTLFSVEYEWFNFKETPTGLFSKNYANPETLTPGMFGYSLTRPIQNKEYYNMIFDSMEQFDIHLEGMHTETGPGVYEAAIRQDTILKAADKAVLFKNSVKEIASQFGIIASFMAKWNMNLPGCGAHIHQSLWDSAGEKNLFHDPSQPDNMSKMFRHFIAGQLHCLPYILPMYAPTINSYKRLVEGAWAPTTQTWGIDNRTTALRVLNNDEKSTRAEIRVPGADINPYLALSAALASGLYGIEHKLELSIPKTIGSAYNKSIQNKLPVDLSSAVKAMKESDIAVKLFGKTFCEHFIQTREWEIRQYAKQVSEWEIKRYFEII